MALTLSEIVTLNAGHKKLAIYKVTGDGSSYQVAKTSLRLQRIEAAWTENVNDMYKLPVRIENYDYLDDSTVSYIEIGDSGGPIANGKEHLLFVIGF